MFVVEYDINCLRVSARLMLRLRLTAHHSTNTTALHVRVRINLAFHVMEMLKARSWQCCHLSLSATYYPHNKIRSQNCDIFRHEKKFRPKSGLNLFHFATSDDRWQTMTGGRVREKKSM